MTIRENVEAVYRSVGENQFVSSIGSMGAALGGMGSVISRVTGLINPLNIAIAGLGAGGAALGISHVGSEFENMQISMAQTLRFMGQGGDTFQSAMTAAEGTINRVYAAAAALPGQAEDYASALALAGANVNRAVGDYDTSFNLIRDMTAVGVSMGRGATESAMLLNRALDTNRGMLEQGSDFTMAILNAMRQLPGQANVTAASFNRMRLEERVRLMSETVGQFGDMIEASSGTWSAVTGAASTTMNIMARMSTAPLFRVMTQSLQRINALFIDGDGNLTEIGRLVQSVGSMISSTIGRALEHVVGLIENAAHGMRGFMDSIVKSPVVRVLDNMLSRVEAAGRTAATREGGLGGVAGGAIGGGVAVAGMAAGGVAFGPLFAAVAALGVGFGNFLTRTKSVNEVLGTLGGMFDMLTTLIEPAVALFQTFSNVMGDIVEGVLPGLLSGLSAVLDPIVWFVGSVWDMANTILGVLRPSLGQLAESAGQLLAAMGQALAPIVRIVGNILLSMYDVIARAMIPVIQNVINYMQGWIRMMTRFMQWLGRVIGEAVERVVPAVAQERPETTRLRGMLDSLVESMQSNTSAQETANRQGTGPPRPPRAPGGRPGRPVQDFRGSRFEIQQQFERGFDPDRIAVAFASDIGRLGEQRLQSGFEPAFGVR